MKPSEVLCKLSGFELLPAIALIAISLVIASTTRADDKPAGPSLKDALKVYAEVTGRTILRPATVPASAFLSAQIPGDTNTAPTFIEREAAKLGFEIVPDGQVFARVLPKGWRDTALGKYLKGLKAPPHKVLKADPTKPEMDVIEAGTINFFGVDLAQVLDIYADLANRTVLYPVGLSSAPLWIKTQSAMSKAEAVYALDTVLALSGVAMKNDGDKFVQFVQVADAAKLKVGAPRRKTGDKEIKPEDIPAFRPAIQRVITRTPKETTSKLELWEAMSPSPIGTADNLLAYYAKISGSGFETAAEASQIPIRFKAGTPLTKSEILYAIEKTLELNGLKIVHEADKTIRVQRIGDPIKRR